MFYNTLRKREIKDLYGISYPTLRKRLKAAGLQHFIGRRIFNLDEIYWIFKFLGLPEDSPEAVSDFIAEYEAINFRNENKDKKSGADQSFLLLKTFLKLKILALNIPYYRERIKEFGLNLNLLSFKV